MHSQKVQGTYKRFMSNGDLNVPDYYPGYREGVEQRENISYHADKGKFPDRLFMRAAPNQSPKEFEYVKSIYKQVTLPVFLDLLSCLQRPLNDKNWSIEWPKEEKDEDGLRKYLETQIRFYGSLENFFKSVVPSIKTRDPEGVIAVKPSNIEYDTNEAGEVFVKEDALLEPCPYYYDSMQVVGYEYDKYYLIELADRSEVDYGGQKKAVGLMYEFYDENTIYHIKQIGKFTEWQFELTVYFQHNWNRIPVTKLMGDPVIIKERVFWQSPFSYSTDLLDNVAVNANYLQASIRNSAYPYKIMIGDICEFEDPATHQKCVSGKVYDPDKQAYGTCVGCGGSGLVNRTSPVGTMLLRPSTSDNQGETSFSQPPLQYIAPDTAILQFMEDKNEKDLLKARDILHLSTSNTNVKGSVEKTATGFALDTKSQYAFVQPQIHQLFQIWEFVIAATTYMRYGEKKEVPRLVFSNSFDFTTEEEALVQIGEAIKLGLPPFVVRVYLERFLKAMYFNELQSAQILDTVLASDRILTMSADDVLLKERNGDVADWEVVLHDSSISFIKELMEDNANYLNQDIKTRKEQLVAIAKKRMLEIDTQDVITDEPDTATPPPL